LYNRPPEKNSGCKEGQLFELVPPFRPHAQFEEGGNMPQEDAASAGKPAQDRLSEEPLESPLISMDRLIFNTLV
jgi:hypothetical protein